MKTMKRMKLVLVLIAMTIFVSCENGNKQVENKVNDFFNDYEKINATKAIENLYKDNKWTASFDSSLTSLKNQLEYFRKEIGVYSGRELITEKKVGDSYLYVSYLVKHERMPLRFSFQFYKPKNDWIIYNFKFDNEMSSEIENAGSLIFLNLDKK